MAHVLIRKIVSLCSSRFIICTSSFFPLSFVKKKMLKYKSRLIIVNCKSSVFLF